MDKALVDLSEAIRLDPKLDRAYSYRGWVWYWQRNYRNALADYRKAAQLDPKSADYQNALAWFFATCPDARYRSGREAITVATKACQLSDWKNAAIIDTLACALAETGQFDAAIARMNLALRQLSSRMRVDQTLRSKNRAVQRAPPISRIARRATAKENKFARHIKL